MIGNAIFIALHLLALLSWPLLLFLTVSLHLIYTLASQAAGSPPAAEPSDPVADGERAQGEDDRRRGRARGAGRPLVAAGARARRRLASGRLARLRALLRSDLEHARRSVGVERLVERLVEASSHAPLAIAAWICCVICATIVRPNAMLGGRKGAAVPRDCAIVTAAPIICPGVMGVLPVLISRSPC
jgi:hypothetical protein